MLDYYGLVLKTTVLMVLAVFLIVMIMMVVGFGGGGGSGGDKCHRKAVLGTAKFTVRNAVYDISRSALAL